MVKFMQVNDATFLEYYSIYEIAAEKEKNNDVDGALELYLDILKRYAPVGIIYYERPAIILEKRKEYEKALEVCNLALNNPQRFNKPTGKSVKEKFTKRKNRLLDKIAKSNGTNEIKNKKPVTSKKVSVAKSTKNNIDNKIITTSQNLQTEIIYPDWYISISFGESKSPSFAQAVALAKLAPQFIINNVEGKKLYQAIYSDKPNEYLQFIKLYELVSDWKSCFVVLNGKVMDRKIVGKLNYCYGDKCRSGNPDFCYGASYMTENPFGCHRLQISACNNPWTSFGQYDTSGVFHVDKVAIKNRIMSYSIPYLDCPCFSLERVLDALDKLPDKLTKKDEYNLNNSTSTISCANQSPVEEKPKSFINKLIKFLTR
ncbi:hypothetical protein [uncultured Clostridium sp.]|uniref:hypothetical protein n=1 Tax=uncultured Clostridium sp. TaxID=59620 RepID=UPI002602209E|nr:hypothetical protein [uncultured Clostridium sp.]